MPIVAESLNDVERRDSLIAIQLLVNVAHKYASQGAVERYRRLLKLSASLADQLGVGDVATANALQDYGLVCDRSDDTETALAAFSSCYNLALRIGAPDLAVASMNERARILGTKLHRFEDALDELMKARQICVAKDIPEWLEKIDDRLEVAFTWILDFARKAKKAQDLQTAQRCFAAVADRATGPSHVKFASYATYELARGTHDARAALPIAEKALRLARQGDENLVPYVEQMIGAIKHALRI